MSEKRAWLACSAVHGALAVGLGAFAAHALNGSLPAERLAWLETGARYQLLHAVALLALQALGNARVSGPAMRLAGWAFALGPVGFSGGLYLAALLDWTWLMPVVPVGGTALLLGWVALAVSALRRRENTQN